MGLGSLLKMGIDQPFSGGSAVVVGLIMILSMFDSYLG